MKLSIIVPVYGVEQYIEKCISSLLIPDNTDYEIIIVNDGTKDRSIDIVRERFFDPRIRIIEQENGGLSSARNLGIKSAKGEYVWMFDSDDWAETEKLSDIINMLGGMDLLFFNEYYRNFDENGRQFIFKSDANAHTGMELALSKYHHPVQFYIIRKKILIDSTHLFVEGILHEDSLFTPIAITLCSTVKCYKTPIYHYRQREGSITKVVNAKRIYDLIFVIDHLMEFGKNKLPKHVQYKWGRCIAQLLNEVLYISQSCNDKDAIKQLQIFVNKNWEAYKYLCNAGIKNKIMGVLGFITLGKLYEIYKLLFKLRYDFTHDK